MPIYDAEISNFVCGDDIDISRTISNIPSGQTIVTATFTVKALERATSHIFQKVISPVINSDGVISDVGASGTGALTFTVSAEETAQLLPKENCYYWIDILTSAGKIYTPEKGIIRGEVNN